jgi:DNA-binding SARP family transcriptional activator
MTFSLLGRLEVRLGERLVEIHGATANRLLGALLVHVNQWVPEARLTEYGWGEADVTRNALHCAIARTRRILRAGGPGVEVEHSEAGYRLPAHVQQVDSQRFLALADRARAAADPGERFDLLIRALGLWRGEVLGNISEALSRSANALMLERGRLDCACALADTAILVGREAEALRPVEELAALAPYDEALQARLVMLMGGSGRRAVGLRLYEHVRRRLVRELGVDPSNVMQEAYYGLLRAQEPQRDHEQLRAQEPQRDHEQRRERDGAASLTNLRPETPRRQSRLGPRTARAQRLSALARRETVRVTLPPQPQPQPPASAPAYPSVPAQLPSDLLGFSGRDADVKELWSVLTPEPAMLAVPTALLCGQGGSGKTALAVHVAHLLRPEFPHGQLYAELGVSGARPREPAEILTHLLHSLDVPDSRIPDRLDERAALYRSCLASRRMLVVLDDVPDDPEVRHLIPGTPASAVILTSRSPVPSLKSAFRFHLD